MYSGLLCFSWSLYIRLISLSPFIHLYDFRSTSPPWNLSTNEITIQFCTFTLTWSFLFHPSFVVIQSISTVVVKEIVLGWYLSRTFLLSSAGLETVPLYSPPSGLYGPPSFSSILEPLACFPDDPVPQEDNMLRSDVGIIDRVRIGFNSGKFPHRTAEEIEMVDQIGPRIMRSTQYSKSAG